LAHTERYGGAPSIINRKHVMINHDSILKELAEKEYFRMKANEIRGLSRHCMVFFGSMI